MASKYSTERKSSTFLSLNKKMETFKISEKAGQKQRQGES